MGTMEGCVGSGPGELAGLTGQGEGESGPFAGVAVEPYLSTVLIDHFFAKG